MDAYLGFLTFPIIEVTSLGVLSRGSTHKVVKDSRLVNNPAGTVVRLFP